MRPHCGRQDCLANCAECVAYYDTVPDSLQDMIESHPDVAAEILADMGYRVSALRLQMPDV